MGVRAAHRKDKRVASRRRRGEREAIEGLFF